MNPSSVRIENGGNMWAVCEVTDGRGEELMELVNGNNNNYVATSKCGWEKLGGRHVGER